MKKFTLCSLLCLFIAAAATIWADVLPENYRIEPVIRNITNPQAMALAPDGRIFFLERTTGNVRIIEDGKLLATPFVTLSVSTVGEEGLLGIAIEPGIDFPAESFFDVYFYYTQASPHTNRIVRYSAEGDVGTNEAVILDNIGYAPTGTNNGGGLVFGTDGMLYATIGDLESPGDVQGDTFNGKVLQIDVDTAGFPYTIYARGLRNSADIAVNKDVSTIYATDNYDSDDTCDETNVITSAGNFGWNAEACVGSSYAPPLHAIDPQINPSGLTPYTQTVYPGFDNNLFIAGEANGEIIRDVLSGASYDTFSSTSSFYDASAGDTGCPTDMKDVVEGEDGWLYAVSNDPGSGEAGIYRVIYDDLVGPREVSASPYVQLTVAKEGGGLKLWWEDLKRDAWGCTAGHCPPGSEVNKYTVWSGTLANPISYDHTALAETDGTEENDLLLSYNIATMPEDDTYYLVSARGANLEGTTGYRTGPFERPGYVETEICNSIGWNSNGEDQCVPDWPHSYPDQYNNLWNLHDWRGKVIKLTFVAFT